MTGPRLRFAPAPTGYLHVGSARTALVNWIHARQNGGTLVLRIEDTDAERSRPELVDTILDALRWLGIDWDEGPVHQSERSEIYRDAVEKLLADGRAYLVDGDDQRVAGAALRDGHAARFAVGDEGATTFSDVIRGDVTVAHDALEDFVIWRVNGTPTFLVANAVDDLDLGITHVLRGEDLLAATTRILLIRDALDPGAGRPVFAHLPLLVNEQRKKLSKRRDDVAVADFRAAGYLPEAMANYLALLGWGPPDGVEVRPMNEIVDLYRLADVTKAAAFFDLKKLDHINGEYIRALPTGDFLTRVEPYLTQAVASRGPLVRLGAEVQARIERLDQAEDYVDFAWRDEPVVDEKSVAKHLKPKAAPVLDAAVARLEAVSEWAADPIRAAIEAGCADVGFVKDDGSPQIAKFQGPVRVAVTGRAVGPPLFQSLEVLGRERALGRLRAARLRLS